MSTPDSTRLFVLDHLRNLHDLQLLIAIVEAPDRWWDSRAAARELQVPDSVARSVLEHLARRNLLEIRVTEEVRYQFRPGSDALRAQALAFADACRADPLELVRALSEAPPRTVRDFADAFRLRRRDR